MEIRFTKMHGIGNDYIYINCMDGVPFDPAALSMAMSPHRFSVGGDGIILICASDVADAKMRIFNGDGSEGMMGGNAIRCVAKYLYDNGIVAKKVLRIETGGGVRTLRLYTMNGKVSSVSVDMGVASLLAADVGTTLPGEEIVARPVVVGGKDYEITCVSVGNPHCVVLCKRVDEVDVPHVGPLFENAEFFPDRINTEFVRVVNAATLKMRVWERGNGETLACGTGACAAVVAATRLGFLAKGVDVTVQVPGGELIVRYTDEGVTLTGEVKLVYEGVVEI